MIMIVLYILLIGKEYFCNSENYRILKGYNRNFNASVAKVLDCLHDSLTAKNNFTWSGESVEAEIHYRDVLSKTEKYRGVEIHESAGYNGPWIENRFIEKFISKPLSYFNGLLPLFVQWVDIHVFEMGWDSSKSDWNQSIPRYSRYYKEFDNILRNDMIYVTVSQDDEGILPLLHQFPNILVISAGGHGHIPIPLIKGECDYIPINMKTQDNDNENIPIFEYEFGFYGNLKTNRARQHMISDIQNQLNELKVTYNMHPSNNWKEMVSKTKFNLSPRGYGRNSFRLAEIIHIGRIPVYLYDDIPWIPYVGTNISIEQFGFTGRMGNLNILVKQAVAVGKDGGEIARRLEYVRNVREHYTYEGVLRQMELFFRDPLGPRGGHLRCVRVPDTDKRRK